MTNSSEKEQAKVHDKEQEIELKQSSMDEAGESKIELVPELPDGYELIEKLGEGGMGRVYRVRDLSLDKEFAIKILQQDLSKDASALKRFNQEIDAAAALSHANLISIYKHGTTDNGEPYLVMDYLEGPSLAELIEKGTDFAGNANRLLDIFIQICEALAHAHENGVIHRDIKPSNIIITKAADGKELVKIVDFGIARVIEASNRETHNLTQTGEVFGSPHYMSPEQCLGLMLTQHSDIYSLGCTLYEAITGSPPFAGANPIQLVVKHINENVSGFDKDLKRGKALKQLETITLKCLSKEMDDRYASVTALKEDLEKVKEGKTIPKYVLDNRAKPTISLRHIFIFTTLGLCLSIFCSHYAGYLNLGGQQLSHLILILFLGPGFALLILKALTKIRSIRAGHNSAREWWIMIMALTAGLAGFSSGPYEIGMAFFGAEYDFPQIYRTIANNVSIFHIPLLLVLCSSALCFCLFNARSAGIYYVATRLALSIAVFTFALSTLAPDMILKVEREFQLKPAAAEKLPSTQGRYLHQPPPFSGISNTLAIVDHMVIQGDVEGAIQLLNSSLSKTKLGDERSFYLLALARLHSDQGKFEEALKFIQQIEAEAVFLPNASAYLSEKARCFQGLGEFSEAIEVLDNKLFDGGTLTIDYASDVSLRRSQIYCSKGDYKEAIGVLNTMISEDPYPTDAVLLRAILKEQTGDLKKAHQDYEIIAYSYPWREPGQKVNERGFLRIAYALKRLGDEEGYAELKTQLQKGVEKIPPSRLRYMLGLVDDSIELNFGNSPLAEAR